jgi:hypothetical protein
MTISRSKSPAATNLSGHASTTQPGASSRLCSCMSAVDAASGGNRHTLRHGRRISTSLTGTLERGST